MACEIKILKGEEFVFATKYFNFSHIEEFKALFLLLDKKFPDKEGFELVVSRYQYMPAIERHLFREACQTDDWRDPLKLFVLAAELVAFRGSVRILHPDDAQYYIDNFEPPIGLSSVRCYNGKAVIFEISGQKPLFKISGPVEFESTHLGVAEYELYLTYLRYLDPFPNP